MAEPNDPGLLDELNNTISVNYFLVGAKVTTEHVSAAFGEDAIGLSQQELTALVRTVDAVRKDAIDWGDQKASAMIVKYMAEYHPHLASWNQLRELLKTSPCDEKMVAMLFYSCYGGFDERPGWEVELEQEYMTLQGLSYEPNAFVGGKEKKGCFSKLFTNCKNTRIKSLRHLCKKHHEVDFGLKRKSSEITKETRFQKRPKGSHITSFATVKGKPQYQPDVILKNSMKKEREEQVSVVLILLSMFVAFL